MASVHDVENFLKILNAKMMISTPEILFINSRTENTQTLADLEITVGDQLRIVKSLTVKQYSSGPLDDDNKHRNLIWWVFGVEVKKKEIYIKISLNELNRSPICISFHLSKNNLSYPFNNQ